MPEIRVNEEKCSGCGNCKLWCSISFDKSFNPLKAYISQNFFPGVGFKITFTDDCNECGICAKNCEYGALVLE